MSQHRVEFMPKASTRGSMSVSRTSCRLLAALVAVVSLQLVGAAPAVYAAGPAFEVDVSHSPAVFHRGDVGVSYTVAVRNVGDAPTSAAISVADGLPAGFMVQNVTAVTGGGFVCPSVAAVRAGTPLTCTRDDSLAVGDSAQVVIVAGAVSSDAPDALVNTVTVSGGGAGSDVSSSDSAPVQDRAVFDVLDFVARSLDSSGHDDMIAGGRPYQATASFSFPTYVAPTVTPPVAGLKSIFTELPPGFVGNAAALSRCRLEQLVPDIPTCPESSRIGEVSLGTNGNPGLILPLYNMVPERGYPAEFAFKVFNNAVVAYPVLRPRTGQYGVTVVAPGAAPVGITSIGFTLYGVPSDRNGAGGPRMPFLANPLDCLEARPTTRIMVDSWQRSGRLLTGDAPGLGTPDLRDPAWKTASYTAPPVTACDAPVTASQFAPAIDMRPTPETGTKQADAPSGYTVELSFPQTNDPTDRSTVFDPTVPAAPPLKDAVVTLPEGVAVSPAAADGLDGCSDLPGSGDQVHYDNTLPVSCPNASKIGSVVATSPLLAAHDPRTDEVTGAEPISGDVYLLRPHPGDLSATGDGDGTFRVLIQALSDRYGINAKLPGVVSADRTTGRLTARFADNPQLPVKHLSVVFKGGDRAALVNPATCGSARTSGAFTPWSRAGVRSDGAVVPGTAEAGASSIFEVSWDGKGASCPATLPFAPHVSAGLSDSTANGSSPFTFDLTREDRTDVLGGVNVALPGGLLASVKNVPLCANSDADAGTCPASSRVGSATVAAGSGGRPFYITNQSVSLTGPYKGAPYGLAIAVRAVAGPFDLGTVVVRQALEVDPNDTHATVVSDPLPTIRDGVPLRVRHVHVVIDRPGFMRAPSSCAAKAVETRVTSPDGRAVNVSSPLQAVGCDRLRFAPRLAMRLTDASQTKVGGHPGVEASVTQQPGEASVKSLTVTLPLSLALDPDNAASDSLCEFADGLRNQCPPKSVIGTMTAISPLLKAPLTGKVYFVKGIRTDPKSGRLIKTLPTLLIELRGEVNVNLRATSSVPDGKHLTTTFPTIPDAPLSSAFLKLNGGKRGILVVTDGHSDICYTPQKPFLSAVGHNGKRIDAATSLAVDCRLAIVSRKFTSSSVRVRVSGIGAGTVTVSGVGLRSARRTVASATSATLVARLTSQGKRMRKAKREVRVKVSFVARGTKKATVVYAPGKQRSANRSSKT